MMRILRMPSEKTGIVVAVMCSSSSAEDTCVNAASRIALSAGMETSVKEGKVVAISSKYICTT